MGVMTSGPRVATPHDAARVTDLLVGAFAEDPTWAWAFPDPLARPAQHRRLWGLMVAGALRYPWVWLTAGDAATSVWIPPGGTELSAQQEASIEPMLREVLGDGAGRVLDTLELFDAAHPREEPHYYLSLLATDPAQRGRGLGLGLLADNLTRVDADGAPAYLEASNPANVPLYERHGFEVLGFFDLPDSGPRVHTMWRPPRSSGRP